MLASGLARDQIPGSYRLEHVVADVEEIVPSSAERRPGSKLRVVHIPNHPHFKGTRYLRDAIDHLAGAVDYVEATGISNERVHELIAGADLVVDQLIGGYLGMTSLEAMAHGKPVICYVVDPSLLIAPDQCPVINADPETILDVLAGFVADPDALPDIGRRSRQYVEEHYSVRALAGRLKRLYVETSNVATGRIGER
jgi:glycosyltransferase involved in cell wall biosynthesis